MHDSEMYGTKIGSGYEAAANYSKKDIATVAGLWEASGENYQKQIMTGTKQ